MCDSMEDGGARCAAHTRPGYMYVVNQLLADPEARASVRNGFLPDDEPNAIVIVSHASTKAGHAEVSALAETLAEDDPETADWLRHCLRRGERKAEAVRAVKDQITQRSLRSALRRLGAMRSPHRNDRTSPLYKMLRAAAEHEATARYDTFKRLADNDKTLRAPDGWIDDFKATGTHTRAVPTDRATAYALWRTQTTGSDFAPDHYDPDMCLGVVTRLDGFRPGDVIDEPGFRTLGAVEHEGKTIKAIHQDETGKPNGVEFTDGTSAPASDFHGIQFTVYRHATHDEMAQMRRYREAQDRADAAPRASSGGHIPGQGWFVDDPATGERVFDAWGH